MTAEAAVQTITTPVDRFSLTLTLAILAHAVFILGVTFTGEDKLKPRFDTMEIVLVQQQSEAPEQADLLAQANLRGGGDSEEEMNPATPLPAPFPDQTPEVTAPPPAVSSLPDPVESPGPESVEESPRPEATQSVEQLTVEKPVADEALSKKVEQPESEPVPKKRVAKTIPKPRVPSATELLTNSFKIASLSAEIRRKLEAKAKRPRRKFISANTREYNYAAYMESWRAKVERVGNLNYPEAARKQNLSGSLVLDVALNADGSINDITIRRSSGHKLLDDAAARIVNLASPFAPFPDHIAGETDILHIMRTWQFINNRGFR